MKKFCFALLNVILIIAPCVLIQSEEVRAQTFPYREPWNDPRIGGRPPVGADPTPDPVGTCKTRCLLAWISARDVCRTIDPNVSGSGEEVCDDLRDGARSQCALKPPAERPTCLQEADADHALCLVQPEGWCMYLADEQLNACKLACQNPPHIAPPSVFPSRPVTLPPVTLPPKNDRRWELMTPS
jgi:hypothetical protein